MLQAALSVNILNDCVQKGKPLAEDKSQGGSP